MAFMNARKRNRMLTYVIVGFVSVGLLLSVSLYWTGGSFSGGSSNTATSTESSANQDFEAALDLWGKGKTKEAAKKFTSAIKGYEEVLKTTPENIAVLGNLATSYHYTGNTDKAIETVKKALEISPSFSVARINYAIYLFEGKQNKEEAIKELEKIGKDDPNYGRAQELLQAFKNSSPTLPAPPQNGNTPPPPPQNGAPLPPPPDNNSASPQPPKN